MAPRGKRESAPGRKECRPAGNRRDGTRWVVGLFVFLAAARRRSARPWLAPISEKQLYRKLNLALAVGSSGANVAVCRGRSAAFAARNRAKPKVKSPRSSVARPAIQAGIRRQEIRAVRKVEELSTELRVEPLGDLRILQNCKVKVNETRPQERIPSGIAERASGLQREAGTVDPLGLDDTCGPEDLFSHVRIATRSDVRTGRCYVIVKPSLIETITDAERRAALRGKDSAQPPAFHEAVSVERQLVDHVRH